jgi:hypothetical protein
LDWNLEDFHFKSKLKIFKHFSQDIIAFLAALYLVKIKKDELTASPLFCFWQKMTAKEQCLKSKDKISDTDMLKFIQFHIWNILISRNPKLLPILNCSLLRLLLTTQIKIEPLWWEAFLLKWVLKKFKIFSNNTQCFRSKIL